MEVRLDVRSVGELRPYANNAKRHGHDDVALIAESIQKYGFNDPIGILPDGTIVEGHGRLMAAQSLGMETVPVLVLEGFTERQAKLYRIAHNRITLNGAFDFNRLATEMRALSGEGIAFSQMGFHEEVATNILDMFGGQGIKAPFRPVQEMMPAYEIVWDDEAQKKDWDTLVSTMAAKGDGRSVTQQIIDMIEETGVLDAAVIRTSRPAATEVNTHE